MPLPSSAMMCSRGMYLLTKLEDTSVVGWLWRLLTGALQALGLWRKTATVLFLGLDNAGKTTLMYKLKDGALKSFIPTQRAQAQELQIGSMSIKAWDLGGHEIVRELWRDYFLEADAIMFMVDTTDTARFQECRKELDGLLATTELSKVPIAVLANKVDLPYAVPNDYLIATLGLQPYLTDQNERPFALFRTSVVDGTGYLDAFSWLARML